MVVDVVIVLRRSTCKSCQSTIYLPTTAGGSGPGGWLHNDNDSIYCPGTRVAEPSTREHTWKRVLQEITAERNVTIPVWYCTTCHSHFTSASATNECLGPPEDQIA